MALSVKPGTVVNMNDKKTGNGQRGAWVLIPVKAEKGYDSITVFADNAEQAQYFTGEATIESITEVTVSNKQGNNGQWFKQFTVRAVIKGKDGNADVKNSAYQSFMQLSGDADLPFN